MESAAVLDHYPLDENFHKYLKFLSFLAPGPSMWVDITDKRNEKKKGPLANRFHQGAFLGHILNGQCPYFLSIRRGPTSLRRDYASHCSILSRPGS